MSHVRRYVRRNWWVITFIFIPPVLWGILKGDSSPWQDWEEGSVVMTITYAIIVYVKLFRDDEVDKKSILWVLPALFFISLAAVLSIFGDGDISIKGHALRSTRTWNMGLLFVGSFLFCVVDIILSRSGCYRNSYINSLKFSDIPVTIAFLILLIYSWRIGRSSPELATLMEPFFGGAVAFQMMLSNVVWSFTDDAIFDSAVKPQQAV